MTSVPVAVVGAGISGLSAAYELHRRGVECVLLEASNRTGGVIRTEHLESLVVDAGPDSFLIQKPAALDLCRELGLTDRLIALRPPRTAYVLRAGVLHPLPEASLLGVPTTLASLARSRLLSPLARLRVALDLVLPGQASCDEESIASFFRRRFGNEALQYIGEPLLAGIHAGDVERLSVNALFPRLVEAERQHGSVIRGLARTLGASPRDGAFRSLQGGMQTLVDAIERSLPSGVVRHKAQVLRVHGSGPFTVVLGGAPDISARAAVLAVPAFVASEIVAALDPALARLCGEIRHTSTATVVLSYSRGALAEPLAGSGFVVPRAEPGIAILAATWISAKWMGRAPEDQLLLRGFVGGARDPAALERSDAELVRAVHADLARIMRLQGEPGFARVYRWERANPQHEVGHLAQVAAIDRCLAHHPGLFLTGSAFRGVGIPDCIADGRATGAVAAAHVSVVV